MVANQIHGTAHLDMSEPITFGGKAYNELVAIMERSFPSDIDFYQQVYCNIISLDEEGQGYALCYLDQAIDMIKTIVTDFEKGQILNGTVVSIKEFGAFVEFAPGKEGMVHISKIAKTRIDRVEDVLTLGDKVTVICLGKDKTGRFSFSMKDVPSKEGMYSSN